MFDSFKENQNSGVIDSCKGGISTTICCWATIKSKIQFLMWDEKWRNVLWFRDTTNDMTYIQYDLWYNKSCRMIIFTLSKYAGYILMLLYSEIMLRLNNLQIKFTFQEHHLLSIFPLFLFLNLLHVKDAWYHEFLV